MQLSVTELVLITHPHNLLFLWNMVITGLFGLLPNVSFWGKCEWAMRHFIGTEFLFKSKSTSSGLFPVPQTWLVLSSSRALHVSDVLHLVPPPFSVSFGAPLSLSCTIDMLSWFAEIPIQTDKSPHLWSLLGPWLWLIALQTHVPGQEYWRGGGVTWSYWEKQLSFRVSRESSEIPLAEKSLKTSYSQVYKCVWFPSSGVPFPKKSACHGRIPSTRFPTFDWSHIFMGKCYIIMNRKPSKFHFKKQLFWNHKRNAVLMNIIIWRCSSVASWNFIVKFSISHQLAESFANIVSY